MTEQRHDDHIWICMHGEAWAICEIPRKPDGSFDMICCWRGYWPFIQYMTIDATGITSWEPYCDAAVKALEGAEQWNHATTRLRTTVH